MQIGSSSSQTETVSPSTFSVRRQMMDSLRTGREYRRSFVEEKIRTGLAIQTKAIRESKDGMTQLQFAEMLGKSQSWVARLENPNASPPTLTTLLKVAATFDVDLVVRYAPFSETVDWVSGNSHLVPGLSPESLAVPDFEHDVERGIEKRTPSPTVRTEDALVQAMKTPARKTTYESGTESNALRKPVQTFADSFPIATEKQQGLRAAI